MSHRQQNISCNFINLNQSNQFLECAHKDMMCVHMFIELSARMYVSICVCIVFIKKYALVH
jgi:hypothetical protein